MMYQWLTAIRQSKSAIFLWAAFGLLAVLSAHNLSAYPQTWIDEGFVEQGAINLANHGQYAMYSTEGFRVLDQPLIANGPGVVLPIALMYRLFGVGLLQARLVILGYMLVCVVLFFLLARRIFGQTAALVSTLLVLAVPGEGILYYGRQVLGNIPALCYFFAGYSLYVLFLERKSKGYALAAGLLFGLAMVTKGQYYPIIPALLAVAGLSFVLYRQPQPARMLWVLVPAILTLGGWYLAQVLILGWEGYLAQAAAIRSSSAVTILVFNPQNIQSSVLTLIRSGTIFFTVPGWLYAARKCWRREAGSERLLLPLALIPIWTVWFVFLSIGWPRYLLDASILSIFLSGDWLIALLRWSLGRMRLASPPGRKALPAAGLVFSALLVLFAAFRFSDLVVSIAAAPNPSAQIFTQTLAAQIPSGEMVESWEWQLDPLSPGIRFHHPPNAVVDAETALLFLGSQQAIAYNPLAARPAFLINGPFSKGTGIYRLALQHGCCELVSSTGPYDLYRVIQ